MGIFDFGFDAPDANGWETRVTPGGADANNLSLAERIRAMLPGGSTDPIDPKSMTGQGVQAASKVAGAFAPKPAAPQQAAPAAAGPPPKPGIDPQLLASLGRSPFAAAAGGPPKPAMPKIYQTGQQSPFAAA